LVNVIEIGILPSCARDMAKYNSMPALAGDRESTYTGIYQGRDGQVEGSLRQKAHDLRAERTCAIPSSRRWWQSAPWWTRRRVCLRRAYILPPPTRSSCIAPLVSSGTPARAPLMGWARTCHVAGCEDRRERRCSPGGEALSRHDCVRPRGLREEHDRWSVPDGRRHLGDLVARRAHGADMRAHPS